MTSIKVEEFKNYLKIDKACLDREVEEHPQLFFAASEAYVAAAAERDALKEALATVDAELDGKVRDQFSDEDKVTEAMVKAQIKTNVRHKQANTAYLNAAKQADVLSALKDAFQQRGYMIRDLCQLYIANYFEESSVRQDARSDAAVYKRRRAQLAEARARRA